jgi:hypothetical protein
VGRAVHGLVPVGTRRIPREISVFFALSQQAVGGVWILPADPPTPLTFG